ncbi:histidine phosphatase family protein [uncultured Aliiroseovarius sp.]|uniref:histidine phosphatase family protein n=1 Tax=uncultured Aliiroseovarius sp. TaxID=1658783 RepID=UPI002592B3C5|nr:histidine phosphatase family protein [uncultured Aliiroseovarius sp.]
MHNEFPEIFVVRHGQTEWNLAGRYQGSLDSPLTAKGCRQACDVGAMLLREVGDRNDVVATSSPQGRARRTADLALAPLGWPITEDARLREIAFGAWEGLTKQGIHAGWPELGLTDAQAPVGWHFKSPDGESYADVERRVDRFLTDLTRPSVVFTHGILSMVLRARWLGVGAQDMLKLPGGQGVIFHLSPGRGHRMIEK